MMRYQRVSPDIHSLPNGRKPTMKSFKTNDDAIDDENHNKLPHHAHLESKNLRSKSTSGSTNPSPIQDHQFPLISLTSDQSTALVEIDDSIDPTKLHCNNELIGGVARYAGDGILFQWGHRKRSRGSRTESRIASLSNSGEVEHESLTLRKPGKILRRSAIVAAQKVAAAATPQTSGDIGIYSRVCNLRSSFPAQLKSRGVEDRSGGPARSDKRSPPSPPEKVQKMSINGVTDFSMNPDSKQPSDQETGGSGATAAVPTDKLNLDHLEWPRIYVSLSRKEKEDDFLTMKGTKLPQRPKKRAKNVDKTLQYCFPGMWLSDLTRGRYEVREKKCVKKKRRGLKGMESMDTDSE